MDQTFADVHRHGAAVAVLCGEAGIGKTALVDAWTSGLDRSVLKVATGVSLHEPDPLGPLRSLLAAAHDAEVAAALGGETLRANRSSEEAAGNRYRVFATAADLLFHAATEPTVIIVDDLHWGQAPMHDFVRFFIAELERRRTGHRLLVLLTTRPLPPPHPVAGLLADLARSPLAVRHDLADLADDVVDAIVTSTASGPTSSAYVEFARRAARGNPLRAVAAVRALHQRHVPLTVGPDDERTWGELRLPAALDDPVTAWVHALEPELREDVGRLAVLGTEFSLADATAMLANPAHLQAAIEIGLIDSDGRSVWFAHALYRDVSYDALGPLERQASHAAAAALAAANLRSGADAIRVGVHMLAAGDAVPPDTAAAAFFAAGEAALGLTVWTEAARYLEAVRHLAGAASDTALLHYRLGLAYYMDHDVAAALPALSRSVELAQGTDEEVWGDALVTLMRLQTATSLESLHHPADTKRVMDFLARAQDPTLRSKVLQVLAEAQVMAGLVEESRASSQAALEQASAGGDPAALALAHYACAFADMSELRMHASIDATSEALRLAERSGDWFIVDIMRSRLAFPLLSVGEIDRADQLAAASVASAGRNHEHSNQALGMGARAIAALMRGDLDTAERLARQAGEETRRSSYVFADAYVGGNLALTHLYSGDLQGAADLAQTWPNLPRSGRAAYGALIDACATPRSPPSPEMLRRPRQMTGLNIGYYLAAIDAAVLSGHPHLALGAIPSLESVQEHGLDFPNTYPASISRVLGELTAATGDTERSRTLLQGAAANCEAVGAHVELARTLAGLARLDGAGGDAARRRALDLAARLGLDASVLGDLDDGDGEHPGDETDGWRVVMITDVVASTQVSMQLGDLAYLDLVLRHHEMVRRCLARFNGHEFSESGDGLLAWFDSTTQAFSCALDVQREIASSRSVTPKLEVKVALAGGNPLFYGGRPYGLVLNRAARLAGLARAGQIVLDADAAAAPELSGVPFRSAVNHLRGIGAHRVSYLDNAAAYQPSGATTLTL